VKISKTLGSEEGKALGIGLQQRKLFSRFFTAFGMKFDSIKCWKVLEWLHN
jgi:hypothetical protein